MAGANLNFSLEYYIKLALERKGHIVEFIGHQAELGRRTNLVRMFGARSKLIRSLMTPLFLKKLNGKLKQVAFKFNPDLFLVSKGTTVLPETVGWIREKLGVPTALWYPDDPRYFHSLTKHIAPHYDYVFTCSERSIQMFQDIGVKKTYYLPFACEPSIHKKSSFENGGFHKQLRDLCFIGTYYPRRAKIIDQLEAFNLDVYGPYWNFFKRKANYHKGVYGPDMVEIFNLSKIVLNIHDEMDLAFKANMRVFEATGCRALLFTDKPYGLEKLFTIGKEILCYENGKELVELIEYYLDSNEERMEIAAKGQNRAYKEHTYEDRVETILMKTRT